MYDIIIIGGGLAGLSNAINLSSKGWQVLVLEKGSYPFHKVCGEYVSNEVIPYLKKFDIMPFDTEVPFIDQVRITTQSRNETALPLDLGGFGISRYKFDHLLYKKALERGAQVLTQTKVNHCEYFRDEDYFSISTQNRKTFTAKSVIGNFGKLSVMDRELDRNFLKKPSPYVGVKYHINTHAPSNEISLHNFPNGYCGLSKVEDEKYCLCYLVRREELKREGSIPKLEKNVLGRNPFLKTILKESQFLWEKPLVINEISFARKTLVENHILTGGDASGMITPLCGNGMAMAIHSSKILSPIVDAFLKGAITREQMERYYPRSWHTLFQKRIMVGRNLQDHWFGNSQWSEIAIEFFQLFPNLGRKVIQLTHGKPFR